jgi:predicted nucleic acid-binding protein
MYLAGAPHPNKDRTQSLVAKLINERQRLVSDAEVLQEILHRYASTNRYHDIQPAYDALLNTVDEVLPIDQRVLERAKQIVLGYRRFSARDAVHLAVMQQHGIQRILSFDRGFDGFPGITRLS